MPLTHYIQLDRHNPDPTQRSSQRDNFSTLVGQRTPTLAEIAEMVREGDAIIECETVGMNLASLGLDPDTAQRWNPATGKWEPLNQDLDQP